MLERVSLGDPDQCLTLRELASLLRVSTKTLTRDIRAGKIPVVLIGTATRIRLDDARAYIASHRMEGAKAN